MICGISKLDHLSLASIHSRSSIVNAVRQRKSLINKILKKREDPDSTIVPTSQNES